MLVLLLLISIPILYKVIIVNDNDVNLIDSVAKMKEMFLFYNTRNSEESLYMNSEDVRNTLLAEIINNSKDELKKM